MVDSSSLIVWLHGRKASNVNVVSKFLSHLHLPLSKPGLGQRGLLLRDGRWDYVIGSILFDKTAYTASFPHEVVSSQGTHIFRKNTKAGSKLTGSSTSSTSSSSSAHKKMKRCSSPSPRNLDCRVKTAPHPSWTARGCPARKTPKFVRGAWKALSFRPEIGSPFAPVQTRPQETNSSRGQQPLAY